VPIVLYTLASTIFDWSWSWAFSGKLLERRVEDVVSSYDT